jgi:1,6-anhydro-N-acetylmuramate kinase
MLALGLNSGSSFDGIDAVLVDIDLGQDSLLKRPRFIAGKSVDWPKRIAEQVLAAFENKLSIFELSRLNYIAGALYAEAARPLMRETQTPSEVSLSSASMGRPCTRSPPTSLGWPPSPPTRISSAGGWTAPIRVGCRLQNPRSWPRPARRQSSRSFARSSMRSEARARH